MHSRAAWIFGLALCLSGCGFDAPPPHRTPAPATPPAPLSTVAASLTIAQSQISALLDSRTKDQIVELHDQRIKCGIGQCRLDLRAQREGAIRVGGSGDVLELHLPFRVDADVAAPGFLSMLRAKAKAHGEADARTQFSIGPRWRLQASTHGTVHLEDAHLRMGPLVTNIADLWNANQKKLSTPLWRAMDKQFSGINLKAQVAQAWRQLFVPIPVSRKPKAWLLLRPESLRIVQPRVANGNVTLSLAIDLRAQVVTGEAAPPNRATPLPKPERLATPSDHFAIAVPVTLSYEQAARLAMASLAKRPPRIAGAPVHFTELKILPSGRDVVLAARFCLDPDWDFLGWFSSCGTGYLRGTPRFDAASGVIRITDVHYAIATAGLVLHTMRMLAGDALGRALQSHLVFDESRQIARLDRKIAAALARPQGGKVAMSATIQSFGAPSFTWTNTGFLASFSATGKVRTDLHL